MTQIEFRPNPHGELIAVHVVAEVPTPAPHQVLIEVHASGLNRADLLQRDRDYLPPEGESAVPGLECAGIVVAAGVEVTQFAVGDRVCALLGSGGHATHVLADATLVLPVPDGITLQDAAALPEALCTAWWNLVELGHIAPGDTVLVYGANSGVGHLIGQAARSLGATVIAATRSSTWHHELSALGLVPVDMSADDPAATIQALTTARTPAPGVDVVVDLVGASFAGVTQQVLGKHGRWLSVGLLGGESVELSLRNVIRNRWTITGSSLRSLTPGEKAHVVEGVLRDFWPHVGRGKIAAHLTTTFAYGIPQQAFDRLEAPGTFGKIVLDHERNVDD